MFCLKGWQQQHPASKGLVNWERKVKEDRTREKIKLAGLKVPSLQVAACLKVPFLHVAAR